MPLKDLFSWFQKRPKPEAESAGSSQELLGELKVLSSSGGGAEGLPRHFGDLWKVLQDLAREEDPDLFSQKLVTDHAAESLEGKKDIDRWLNAYLRRLNPAHPYRLPAHHHRHRGFCIVPRHFPSGTRWQCFDEETFLKPRISDQSSKADLIAALDEWLEARKEP